MASLIGWLITIAYIAAALVFARATVQRWQRVPGSITAEADQGDRAFIALAVLALSVVWPFTLAFWGLRDWLWKPADHDRGRLDVMEADRAHWRQQASQGATEQERATAATIADALDDLLKRAGRKAP